MRKSKPKIRTILPDPKYSDTLVTKFVNNMMYSGKKNIAQPTQTQIEPIKAGPMPASVASGAGGLLRNERETFARSDCAVANSFSNGASCAVKLAC